MSVDSPEDIKRDEGLDHRGSSNFYRFLLICMILGGLCFLINHFYGTPPTAPTVITTP